MRVAAIIATFALALGVAGPVAAQYYPTQAYTAPPTPPAAAYGQAAWGQPYGSGSGYVYGRGGVAGDEVNGRVYAATGRASTGYTAYGAYGYAYGYQGGPSYDRGYGYGHDGYDRGYDGHGCGRSACAPPPRRDDCYSGCGGYRQAYSPPSYPSCDYGCGGGYDRGGRYGYSEGGRYYYGGASRSYSSRSYSSRSYSSQGYRDEWGYNDDRPATARGHGRDDGYYRRDRDCGCAYPLDDR